MGRADDGWSVGTVKSQTHAGLAKLRSLLGVALVEGADALSAPAATPG